MKKILALFFVLIFLGSASALQVTSDSQFDVETYFTDSIQERKTVNDYNRTYYDNGTLKNKVKTGSHYEKDGNTYIFDVEKVSKTVESEHENGYAKDVKLTFTLSPNNLTKLLQANKEPWKSIENRQSYFNQNYYFEQGNISSTKFSNLSKQLDNLPVYKNDKLVKTVSIKDKPKNVSVNLKLDKQSTGKTIKIGDNSLVSAVNGGTDDDYNAYIPVNISSVSGTPTISKAQPVLLTCGDSSTTGFGHIQVDCGNIDGTEDIDFSDTNNNRLDFDIETFNLDTGGTATVWVYSDWTRDGSEQLRVHYGGGSVTAADRPGVWNNTGQNVELVYHLNETSGSAIDASPNNRDSSTTEGTNYNVDGPFNGARDFDGSNDYIDTGTDFASEIFGSGFTAMAWVNYDNLGDNLQVPFSELNGVGDRAYGIRIDDANTINYEFFNSDDSNNIIIGGSLTTDTDYMLAQTWDGSNTAGYVDAVQEASGTQSSIQDTTVNTWLGARQENGGDWFTDGTIDAFRLFSESKDSDWMQAEYDASPKSGLVFFNQQASVESSTDSTPPNISYNPSTTSEGTFSQDWVFVNVSATDNGNLASVTEEFDGTNSSFNTNSGDYYWTNHTSLVDGSYNFQAFAEDSSANVNSTAERTVTLDTPPSVTIFSPINKTYSVDNIDLNVSADETINNWLYELDNNGTNITFTPNTTLTGLSDGSHSLKVYANDSSGNIGSSSVQFTVDATPPSITYTSGTTGEGLKTVQDWIFVNVSATDNQELVSVTQEFNGVNTSFANQNGQYYWENHTNLNNGNYTVKAYAEDGAGSISNTSTLNFEISTPVQEFNNFTIDTESEWAQGTNTNMSTSSSPGFLELYYGNGQNGYTNFFFEDSGNFWTADNLLGTKLLFGQNTKTSINVGDIGGTADITGDSRKEIFFEDENNNGELLYYNPSTDQVTRTGLTSISNLGGTADVGNDGDSDIFLSKDTDGDWGYYDTGSQTYNSLPEAGTGIESLISVGGTGDWDGDGDVHVIYDGEDLNDDNYVAVYDVQAQTDTQIDSGGGFSFDSLDISDYDEDGDLDAVFEDNADIDGELQSVDTASNSKTFTGGDNADGFVLDYNQQSGLDIPLADRGSDVVGYYDFGLESASTPYTLSDVGKHVGGNEDIAYSGKGNYTSETINYDKDQEWNNISVKNLVIKNNGEVNLTVETSNDDFTTVNQSQTITNTTLIQGTNTYQLDQLTETTQYARIKISYNRGTYDTQSIDGVTLNSATENQPPTIPQQNIKWLNLGSNNQYREIEYTLTDPDINDIRTRNTPPSGTVTLFTNTTLKVQNFNNVFDYRAEVNDTRGQTGSINSNYTLSETTSFYTPTTGFVNNESYQSLSGAINVDIRGDSSIYRFNASRPGGWLETVTNGDTSTATDTTGTITSSWEWYVDQISTKNFATEVDPSQESTPNTQYVIRNKQVTSTDGTNFSQLEVQPITPSVGTCSNCNTRNISINSGQLKNVTFNASGDFLDRQQQFDFTPKTSPVVLGIDYVGTRNYQIRETGGFDWTNINITNEITSPSQCTQSNNTEIDIPDQSFNNYTVGFSCNPGNVGNPTQTVLNITDGERINVNSSDMQINTNETSNSVIVIRTEKTQWQSSDAYDGGSLEAQVEGVKSSESTEVNITDTGSFFRIRVGDIQNSSLYTDDSTWSLTYTDTSAPDAGGGGGGGIPEEDGRVITFGTTETEEGIESFNVPFGATVTRDLTVRNSRQDDVTAQIEKNDNGICEYVEVERSIDSETFGASGVYEMPPAELSSLGNVRRATETVSIRFSLPSESELDDTGELSCGFDTRSSYGAAENLVIEVSQGFNLGVLGREYCVDVPYASLADNGDGVDSSPVQVCLALWQWLLGLLVLVAGIVFGFRRFA